MAKKPTHIEEVERAPLILKAFAIRDAKTKTFTPPMFLMHRAEAWRAFDQIVNDGQGQQLIQKYPADYSLYEVGEFNVDKGVLTSIDVHDLVAHGADIRAAREQSQKH